MSSEFPVVTAFLSHAVARTGAATIAVVNGLKVYAVPLARIALATDEVMQSANADVKVTG